MKTNPKRFFSGKINMFNAKHSRRILLKLLKQGTILLVLILSFACRSRLKSTTLPKAFENLHVELINFLPEDAQLTNLRVNLFNCTWQTEIIEGTIESSSSASFKLSGVGANGGNCSLKIFSSPENFSTLKFISEPGKLYEASRVVLERNPAQKLVATAILSRSYNRIPSNAGAGDSVVDKKPNDPIPTIESNFIANTKLPNGEIVKSGAEYLAQLQCSPAINYVSTSEAQSNQSLVFRFKTFLLQGTKWKYDCNKLVIFKDGEFTYFADFTPATPVSLQGTAGDTVSLLNGAAIDLKAVSRNSTQSAVSEIFLRVQIGECTEKEKLNPKNKNCYEEPKKD